MALTGVPVLPKMVAAGLFLGAGLSLSFVANRMPRRRRAR